MRDLLDQPNEFALPVTQRGVMRLTPRLRETYLTPECGDGSCLSQACGPHVRIWIWSDRHNVRLTLDLDGFDARRPYEQSVYRWGVSIRRYLADDATASVQTVEADGKTKVEATAETFEEPEVMPDV